MIQTQLSSYIFQGGGASVPGFGLALWPLLFMFAIFYLFLILPQQKKQKRWQEMVNNLKAGDKVITSGGIRGAIIAVKEDAVHLRVPPDNLRLEVAKSAVVSVAREDEPVVEKK
jgi:preprotein translocase subunit YajC